MWLLFLTSGLLCWVLLSTLMRTPWLKIFLDTPDRRKMHQRLVPRMGGLGVILASLLVLWVDGMNRLDWVLVFGGASFLILGLLDDSSLPYYLLRWLRKRRTGVVAGKRAICKFELKVRYKLLMEIALTFSAVYLLELAPDTLHLGNVTLNVSSVSFPLTCVWLIGVMNAFNLIDGIDGLCGGVGVLSLIAIALIASLLGLPFVTGAALIIAGAVIGFLVFNVSPARIFMGDMGSLFLGFSIGVLGLLLLQNAALNVNAFVVILVAGLPIFDELMAIMRRYGDVPAGSSFKKRLQRIVGPDSNHIHHRMLFLGLGHFRAAVVLYTVDAMLLVGAVLLVVVPTDVQYWVLLYMLANVVLVFLLAYNRLRMRLLKNSLYRALQGLNERPWRIGVVCTSPELTDSIACQNRLPFEYFYFSRDDLVNRQAVSLHAILLEQQSGESLDELLQFAVGFHENWKMPMALIVADHATSAKSVKEHPHWPRLGKHVSVYNKPLYIWPLLLTLLEQLEQRHVARPTLSDQRYAHTGNGAV